MKNCLFFDNSNRIPNALFSITTGLFLVFNIFLSTSHAEQAADIRIGSTYIYATPAVGGVTFMSLRVVDPEGEVLFDESNDGNSIQWVVPSWAPDGQYTYELRVGFGLQSGDREENEQPSVEFQPWVQSGTISIQGGAIIPPIEGGSLLKDFSKTVLIAFARFMDFFGAPAFADIQHLDDVIITFSQCVGNDCVNGESFGFDTIRLKENNLRLHFDDTSNSASFPRNDWRIVINDSSNGGASYFAIEDSTAGRQIFRVDAGAPANSLHVDSQGDVGLGTTNPVVELHVVDGDTPTMRLEQNGSSGFAPQTWDVAGNETNFFIRDVTNGSKLPFKIRPGAPNNSLYINTNGDVGLGTSSPQAKLHITGTDSNNSFQAKIMGHAGGTTHTQIITDMANSRLTIMAAEEDDFAPRFVAVGPEDDTESIRGIALFDFGSNKVSLPNAQFLVRHAGGDSTFIPMIQVFGRDSVTFPTGNVGIGTTNPSHLIQLLDSGAYSDGNSWVDVSTREAKDNILELKTEEALETLKNIKPVKFHYKQDPDRETNVGFIAEDVPNLVATKGRKGMVSMEVVAVLTKVVQDQHEMIEKLNKEMMNLKEQMK